MSQLDKAVFLDSGVPQFYHMGDMVNDCPTSKEKYYPSLCRFFDKVEREIGEMGQHMKIEIAAHPRTDHEPYPEYFGKRFTVKGKTCEMVKDSIFVITQSSTATAFAVMYKKPVIFITTDEYEKDINNAGKSIEAMADAFKKKPINIDHEYCIDWDKELFVDESIYANYRECYIKKSGTPEINSWQIVCNRLHEMNREELMHTKKRGFYEKLLRKMESIF